MACDIMRSGYRGRSGMPRKSLARRGGNSVRGVTFYLSIRRLSRRRTSGCRRRRRSSMRRMLLLLLPLLLPLAMPPLLPPRSQTTMFRQSLVLLWSSESTFLVTSVATMASRIYLTSPPKSSRRCHTSTSRNLIFVGPPWTRSRPRSSFSNNTSWPSRNRSSSEFARRAQVQDSSVGFRMLSGT